jgi:hypothetical protein
MKLTHQQADQMSASDKKPAEAQERHFRWADRLPLESDKQPIERSELADFVIFSQRPTLRKYRVQYKDWRREFI